MVQTSKIAKEVSMIMPVIARKVLLDFFQSVSIPQTQIFTMITLYGKNPCKLSVLSKEFLT